MTGSGEIRSRSVVKRTVVTAAVVFLLIGASLAVVGWPYIRRGIRSVTGQGVIELAKRTEADARPIDFYARIVDHQGNPIPGVKVTFWVMVPNYPEVYDHGGWSDHEYHDRMSDNEGLVSLSLPKGLAIRIEKVEKYGYSKINIPISEVKEHGDDGIFYFGPEEALRGSPDRKPYQPNSDDPYIIRMEHVEDQS